MVEIGQLRMWRRRDDGGQFYNISEGTMCLVIQHFDNGMDERGRQRPSTFTVLMDGESSWFFDHELEEHTVVVNG